MGKKNIIAITIGISVLLLAGLGILIYFGFLQSIFNEQSGTGYNSLSVTKDSVILTNLNEDFRDTGFRTNHFLTDEDDNAENINFMFGADNKQFFTFYLESNQIPSNSFTAGGYKTSCVFSPNTITSTPLYKNELESLGFTYMSQQEGYTTSTGDAGICNFDGCCVECTTIGCSGTVNRACSNGGYFKYVVTGENACWTGNYKTSVLEEMATRMTCRTSGDGYDIQGSVGVAITGFYCSVDVSEYPYDYMTLPINPQVEFKLARLSTYYRFENNVCSPITMMENEKTSNDFSLQSECQSRIIVPISTEANDTSIDNLITDLGDIDLSGLTEEQIETEIVSQAQLNGVTLTDVQVQLILDKLKGNEINWKKIIIWVSSIVIAIFLILIIVLVSKRRN